MSLKDLSVTDRAIVLHVVRALVLGPFLDDDDYARRIGLRRPQVEAVLRWWPDVDDSADDSTACIAINNSLHEAASRLDVKARDWPTWFPVSPEEVREVWVRWARARGWSAIGPRSASDGGTPGRVPTGPPGD